MPTPLDPVVLSTADQTEQQDPDLPIGTLLVRRGPMDKMLAYRLANGEFGFALDTMYLFIGSPEGNVQISPPIITTPFQEAPVGVIDGVNRHFTLSDKTNFPLSARISVNGIGQQLNVHYIVSDAGLTLFDAPLPGDILNAYYNK